MQHSDLSKGELTGIIRNWTLHRRTIEKEVLQKSMGRGWIEGMLPMLLTGEVVQDFAGRWEPGQSMTSTVLFEVDFFCMRIKTRNSIYQLDGPGIVLPRMPTVMEHDVGNAILALGTYKGGLQGVIIESLEKKKDAPPFNAEKTNITNNKGEDHE